MGRRFINFLFKASSLIQIEQKDKIAGLIADSCMHGTVRILLYPKTNFILVVMANFCKIIVNVSQLAKEVN